MNKGKKCKLTESEKRERIAAALARKKECERKALAIVERLSEETSTRDSIIDAAKHLNQGYYSDVVTERSITKLCGYPICDKPLTKTKKATFHISLREKKVYNTEDRIQFCSNHCFKASTFLLHQLDSSPLWTREETEIKLRLLDDLAVEEAAVLRLPGKGEVVPLVNQLPLPPEGDLGKHVVIVENDGEDILIHDDDLVNLRPKPKPSILKKNSSKVDSALEINSDTSVITKTGVDKKSKTLPSKKLVTRAEVVEEEVGLVVRRTLSEWFTERTLRLVRGTEDEDEEVDVKLGQLTEDVANLEIEDSNPSEFVVDAELVRETEIFSSKFSAYIQGKEVYEQSIKIKEKQIEEDEGGHQPRLPLLDQHAQTSHRVRIVLDGVGRYLPPLLDYLNLPSRLVQEKLREIVRTFSLGPHNITHTPTQWRLLALQLIFIISEKDEDMRKLIGTKESREHIQILLQELNLATSFLEDTFSVIISTINLTSNLDEAID